jgi:hypothetical protein
VDRKSLWSVRSPPSIPRRAQIDRTIEAGAALPANLETQA